MGFNFGSFASGAAKGISQGIENQAKLKETERLEKEQARREKEQADEDAYKADVAAIYKPAAPVQTPGTQAPVQSGAGNGLGAFPVREQPAAPVEQKPSNPASQGIMSKALDAAPPPAPINMAAQGLAKVQQEPVAAPAEDALHSALTRGKQLLEVQLKHGKLTDAGAETKMLQIGREIEKEGVRDTYANAQMGNLDGALKHFRSTGDNRSAEWGTEPTLQEVTLPNGVKMPSYVGTIKSQGKEMPFNSALGSYSLWDHEKQVASIMEGQKLANDKEKQTSDAKYQQGSLDLKKEDQAITRAHYERSDATDAEYKKARGAAGGIGRQFVGANGNMWRYNEDGLPYDTGAAVKGGVVQGKVAVQKDESGNVSALVDETTGQSYQPLTTKQIRAAAEAQVEAEDAAAGMFSHYSDKEKTKRADALYKEGVTAHDNARQEWMNRGKSGGEGQAEQPAATQGGNVAPPLLARPGAATQPQAGNSPAAPKPNDIFEKHLGIEMGKGKQAQPSSEAKPPAKTDHSYLSPALRGVGGVLASKSPETNLGAVVGAGAKLATTAMVEAVSGISAQAKREYLAKVKLGKMTVDELNAAIKDVKDGYNQQPAQQ